jgi:hypothetical protein
MKRDRGNLGQFESAAPAYHNAIMPVRFRPGRHSLQEPIIGFLGL